MAKKTETAPVTEIATQTTQDLTSFDYGDDATDVGQVGKGFEGQTNEDISIPFINLLQAISPVVQEQKIEGAMAGMWLNPVSQQLWKGSEGILFVAAMTRHEYVQYKPRDIGGGFVARYEIDSPVVAKAKKEAKKFGRYYVDADGRTGEDGDELTETFVMFGVLVDDEKVIGVAGLPFKGTGIKCYKHCMTQVRGFQLEQGGRKKTPPLFAHLLKFTTKLDKNSKGQTFFIPLYHPAKGSIADSLLNQNDERFVAAKAIGEMIAAGTAQGNYERSANDEAGEVDGVPVGADGAKLF